MELSKGNQEERCRQLVKTTLDLWNSLGISRDMVIKILSEKLNNDKALSIFITDIKKVYKPCTDGRGQWWDEELNECKVGFVLNKEIACEIRVPIRYCDECKEPIRDYIKRKITRGVK